jgi:hypothetical protein
MAVPEKDPLGAASDWLSSWRSSFDQVRKRFGTIVAVLLLLLFAGGTIWWNWEDIKKRPGVESLIALCFQNTILHKLYDDTSEKLYSRILRIQRGNSENELCKAWPKGASVQIFERGWMVYYSERQTIYAVEVLNDDVVNKIEKLRWASYRDTSIDPDNHYATPCSELDDKHEKLLEWGFRKIYCESPKARQMLGLPKSRALLTWTQFQRSDAGILLAGIPAAEPQAASGLFLWMKAIFLESDEENLDSGDGEAVTYSMNDIGGNIHCMALWRPASLDPYAYPDPTAKWHPTSPMACKRYIEPLDYIRGGKRCLLARTE